MSQSPGSSGTQVIVNVSPGFVISVTVWRAAGAAYYGSAISHAAPPIMSQHASAICRSIIISRPVRVLRAIS